MRMRRPPFLPVGAPRDGRLVQLVTDHAADLRPVLPQLANELVRVASDVHFDAPFALVSSILDRELESYLGAPAEVRTAICTLARFAGAARGTWWVRPFLNDRDPVVRRHARAVLKALEPDDAFVRRRKGPGWRSLIAHAAPLAHHARGSAARSAHGVPDWADVGALRKALGLATGQLGYLLVASDKVLEETPGPYRRLEIPKRGGGMRLICAPSPQLRAVQRSILRQVLAKLPVHDAAHGFVRGRSVATHAALHAGKALVVGFDLVEFFPSIHFFRVAGLFTSFGYDTSEGRFSAQDEHLGVAETLARLCTYTPEPARIGDGFAPQGAPTSPAIANLVCRRMDERLSGLARALGGVYSRYADDLTFSFAGEPSGGIGRFRWWVDAICHQEGFLVHRRKFRVMRPCQQQLVTGVVVNERPRLSRAHRRRLRAILHNCEQNGLDAESRGRPSFASWLQGHAAWVNAIDPKEGAELLARVAVLLEPPP